MLLLWLLFLVYMDCGDPIDYENMIVSLRPGMQKERNEVLKKLINMQYTRNEIDFKRGTFRAKGDILEIYPSNTGESAMSLEFWGDEIEKITEINPLNGKPLGVRTHVLIGPNSHYATSENKLKGAISTISPFALNVPLLKSISFLEYCILTNFFSILSLSTCIPGRNDTIMFS